MAQLDWSISIVSAGTVAAFQPNLAPAVPPGTPLNAQAGDIVSWGNRTGETHQPWPTQGNTPDGAPVVVQPGQKPSPYFCDPIPANSSSQPQYVVTGNTGTTIYYCCFFHPEERGAINVTTF
jgi:hypothetical protein